MARSKLSYATAEKIRAALQEGAKRADLAKQYNVKPEAITKIKQGISYNPTKAKNPRRKKPTPPPPPDIHLCVTCRWWQMLGTHDVDKEKFCSYMYNTGEQRNSDPSDCNKYEAGDPSENYKTKYNQWRKGWGRQCTKI